MSASKFYLFFLKFDFPAFVKWNRSKNIELKDVFVRDRRFFGYFIEVEKVGRSCIQVTQYSRIVIDDIALLEKKKIRKIS